MTPPLDACNLLWDILPIKKGASSKVVMESKYHSFSRRMGIPIKVRKQAKGPKVRQGLSRLER